MFDILKKLPGANIGNMIRDIEKKGVTDRCVLDVMQSIPRHIFVPIEMKLRSYEDTALPIGYKQTISQPYIVAYMTAALSLKETDTVLEIGTGSGYQTAVLAKLCKKVYSIEVNSKLSSLAKNNLDKLQTKNVELFVGDGFGGLSEHAPFDAIIVTAAPNYIPPELLNQLALSGRMIIPVGPSLHNNQLGSYNDENHEDNFQWLILIKREKERFLQKRLIAVRFVPMVHEVNN